jgi:type I restriction enzyme S subunit
MKNVSRAVIDGLAIPRPPLAEQRRIMAKVKELMALFDQLEAQLASAQDENCRLLEAVLYQALNDGPPAAIHPDQMELHSGHIAIGQS